MARRQRYYFSDRLAARRTRNRKICFIALLLLAASAGSAWSHEGPSSDGSLAPAVSAPSSSPLSMTDPCLSLLKSIRHLSPDPAMDKTQRPAGQQAAVLGYVVGLRIAPGPLEIPQHPQKSAEATALVDSRQPSGDIDGRNALATLAYRHCRKDEALSSLAPVLPDF